MASLSPEQFDFITTGLHLSKVDCARLLQVEAVSSIAKLTSAKAHRIIAGALEELVLKFAPGTKIRVEININDPKEGDPCTFNGDAVINHYETQTVPDGMYLNASIHMEAISREVRRSLPYLLKNAKVVEQDPSCKERAKDTIARYRRLQRWHHTINLKLQKLWTEMLHGPGICRNAVNMPRLIPAVRMQFVARMLTHFESGIQAGQEDLTDEDIRNGIKTVAGFILFKSSGRSKHSGETDDEYRGD